MRQRVLNTLIDEQIKIQEAVALNIELAEAEIAHGISYLEEQNQMPEGSLRKLFKENQVDFNTLERQIKADLGWLKVLQVKNEKPPVVTEDEISKEQKKLEKEVIQPAYLIAEIYIPFGKDKGKSQEKVNELFNQVVAGSSFPELAMENSKGETALSGGDLGWVRPGQMEKAVDNILPYMRAGQLSKPIEGEKGYYL